MNRRDFLIRSAGAAGALGMTSLFGLAGCSSGRVGGGDPLYRISLAEWSLNRRLFGNEMTNLDFPAVAKNEFGVDGIEYVNQFFMDKANDTAYLADLKQRAEDNGVRSLLIMCDREGDLGDPDEAARMQAVENHKKWVDAAAYLGCHAVRVNARSDAGLSYEEQQRLAADGLRALCEYAEGPGLHVLVENHGGLSSNGQWLVGVMELADHELVGTLPDFGNFTIDRNTEYDRYQGVEELMPYAEAVSAKAYRFDEEGNCVETDYHRMMRIVVDAGYHGYVGIEYEGRDLSEHDGIMATKALLERVRAELANA